ncbi:MAG: hypothetical protein IIU55_00470 [Paludibacteraceae bacterium]|jgi:hypothetical protein|nr:hypothetical protein [Paludibacteraceae bacterium]
MKKIFTTFFVLLAALSLQAALHLNYEKWEGDEKVVTEVTQNTTIIVTEYEWDEDLEEALMEVKGQLYSDETENITVTITRQSTGIIDQLCAAGNCVPGNGELNQVCEFTVGTAAFQRSWYTHYTPMEAGEEVISYEFNDGVNPTITLTINYSYKTTAIDNVVAPQYNGKIYNLLGQKMSANELSELPKGIYITNGKKYIKQ